MEGDDGSTPNSNLFLHRLGEVALAVDHEGLSWEPLPSDTVDWSTRCLKYNVGSNIETAVKFSDIYAVELFNGGPIQERTPNLRGLTFDRHPRLDLHHFVVYCFRRSRAQRCLWVPEAYIFGHEELATCQEWVQKIQESLTKQGGRPKSLLVFVHPLSGRGKGRRTWESVQPIFSRANVKTKVIISQRAGHAFDLTTSMTDDELISFDGIVVVGGDGFFNEVLNGLLLSRHKTTLNSPGNFFGRNGAPIEQLSANKITEDDSFMDDGHAHISTDGREDDPLLQNSRSMMSSHANISQQVTSAAGIADHHSVLSFPNDHFRLGLIPAGSTDSIVISTTGARDAVTSALHIILGKRICLDIAQVVRWKTCNTSNHGPSVRYAASFAGYGFYGDVVKESEKYRWMGPRRYDYAGTKVFMRHSSYDADVSFLKVDNPNELSENGSTRTEHNQKQTSLKTPHKKVCRVNCNVCNEPNGPSSQVSVMDGNASSSCTLPENSRWLQTKGRFHCIGAAVISCRNDRAPDGLVADAHLGDGFMHLILIKECPRPLYLWHLTKLTRKGSNPLDFKFVEHHRTPAFTFATSSNESIWNLDGELFQACQLSARVFRGLINLFAAGPEV